MIEDVLTSLVVLKKNESMLRSNVSSDRGVGTPSINLISKEYWHMKDAYAVLRQKELELSRIQNEVEALRLVAPLLDEGEAENSQPLRRAVNETPQPSHREWEDKATNRWP